MSNSNITSINSHAQNRQASSQSSAEKNTVQRQDLTPAQQQKATQNASILASTQVAIGVKNQPLALLLNTAIDRINELLGAEAGDNVIEKSAESALDVSPEATAERIVSLSTGFLSAFSAQHPNEEQSVVQAKFMSTIGSGIEQGFKDARDILKSLDVLSGDIASNIDKTYTLVQEKLAAFVALMQAQTSNLS